MGSTPSVGMSPSTAFSVFAKAVVRERRIPFELSAESEREREQREYEKAVNTGLWESYRQFRRGESCTADEFEQMLERLRGVA